jgi:hypothetical protein
MEMGDAQHVPPLSCPPDLSPRNLQFFFIVRPRRKPITRGASTRTQRTKQSSAAEKPAHRNQASQKRQQANLLPWYSRESGWHVPEHLSQLARDLYVTRCPKTPVLSCESPTTLAWRIDSRVSSLLV